MSLLPPDYSFPPSAGKSGRGECGRRLPRATLAFSATRFQKGE